jgi:hypothetical protein
MNALWATPQTQHPITMNTPTPPIDDALEDTLKDLQDELNSAEELINCNSVISAHHHIERAGIPLRKALSQATALLSRLSEAESRNTQLCRELEAARLESVNQHRQAMDARDNLTQVANQAEQYRQETHRWAEASKKDAFERDGLWRRIREIEGELKESQSQLSKAEGDGKRLDAIQDAGWEIAMSPHGDDDSDHVFLVIEHYMAEPRRRVLSQGHNLRTVIDDAMKVDPYSVTNAAPSLQPLPQTEGREAKLESALKELFAEVNGEAPRLLDDDCGGNGRLYMEIKELLAPSPVSEKGGQSA